MPFLPVTPAFFAALHDAVVEQFVFDATAGRLRLTLLLVSFTNNRFSHRREQVVLSGIRHGADVEGVHRLIEAVLSKSGQLELGYQLDECRLLPQADFEREQGRQKVLLAIDHLPVLHVDCQKITSQAVELL
ncbi:hypothetical protein I2I05_05870 [Hymenobacter sp. BT683]|uniref:Uncharacterized protein n=1 Tax=Hymenobacter jeongseonensis TaxID=2791027 RepID=A0ABS0IEZ9_9BACT|nr:hypothetical protein [Hymenobacter jeongseonensis]MBF9236917.1 hypothetical protein [Hymenobacter jeongseonensis]